ncbi:MAG TPA: hypothetical protein VF627_04615 [Abditibacterium sp.]|jgi:tetratricopeptide (TPR) repeat protein
MTRFLPFLALGALVLGGCAAQNSPSTASDPLRGVAASFVAARAFDRAMGALNRDDSAALQRAGSELRRAADAGSGLDFTPAFATTLSNAAIRLSALAARANRAEKARLLTESDEKYRAALAFAPAKNPETELDAATLNALGYFLADRGQGRADFERAAQLTKAAYEKWPLQSGPLGVPPQVDRALQPQDSYAWSLFKLGRVSEARKQQQEALKIARQIAPDAISPEIPFHFAEILRAAGETDRARREYTDALQRKPNAELRAKIDAGLKALPVS